MKVCVVTLPIVFTACLVFLWRTGRRRGFIWFWNICSFLLVEFGLVCAWIGAEVFGVGSLCMLLGCFGIIGGLPMFMSTDVSLKDLRIGISLASFTCVGLSALLVFGF